MHACAMLQQSVGYLGANRRTSTTHIAAMLQQRDGMPLCHPAYHHTSHRVQSSLRPPAQTPPQVDALVCVALSLGPSVVAAVRQSVGELLGSPAVRDLLGAGKVYVATVIAAGALTRDLGLEAAVPASLRQGYLSAVLMPLDSGERGRSWGTGNGHNALLWCSWTRVSGGRGGKGKRVLLGCYWMWVRDGGNGEPGGAVGLGTVPQPMRLWCRAVP